MHERVKSKRAYDLHEEGKTWDEVGEIMGLSKGTAYQYAYQYRKSQNFFIGERD